MSGELNFGVNKCGLIAIGGEGLTVAFGTHTTVTAADTFATGLDTVSSIVASMAEDPVDGAMTADARAGSGGNAVIKTWKSTDADATFIAATTFSIDVNWIAIGTLAA